MPNQFILKLALVFILCLSVAYFGLNQNTNAREPNAIKISKLGADQISSVFFDLQITEFKVAEKLSDTSTFVVTLTALKTLPSGLTYTWLLPTNVGLVAGHHNDSIENLRAGESQQILIQVTGFSKTRKDFIDLNISGEVFGQQVKRNVLIASQYEKSLEYRVQQNQLRENSLNNKLGLPTKKTKFDIENIIK